MPAFGPIASYPIMGAAVMLAHGPPADPDVIVHVRDDVTTIHVREDVTTITAGD